MRSFLAALFVGTLVVSVQPQSSPPLSSAEALKTFQLAPGYRIELVASEPLVQEPVAFDWDTDGRLWVVEMPGFMANITGSNEFDPIGRVVVLEDKDGDGRMDKRTVFADGLVLARSVKVLERGVLVAEPPNVWLMRDTNGDLKMDAKELVTDKYGRRELDPQENANGFDWALDNVMHTAGFADVELRLKNGTFQVEPTLQRGEWGVTHDDAGRTYRNTNESALHVDLVPTAYFARNRGLLRTRGSYDRLADANDGLNIIWPARPNPGTNRAYQTGIDRADGTLEKFTAVCGPLVYRGDRLPADAYGNVFVAEPAANLVSRLVLTDDGTKIGARKAYERGEFLASTDERFRPVFLSNAPDGTLYLADLYRGIIEHRLSLTIYLRDYILAKRLDRDTGFGRIYRIVHETTRRDLTPVQTRTPRALVDMLSHPNGWRRDTAQRLLVERGDTSIAPLLAKLAAEAKDPRTRLHALWTLDGIGAIDAAIVSRALGDDSRYVRAAAVRLSEQWLGNASHPLQSAVLKLRDDPAWEVRQQLAASLGVLPVTLRYDAAISMLDRYAADPVVVDAVLSGLGGGEPEILQRLLQLASGETASPAVAMLTATIVRRGQEAPIQQVFQWAGDAGRPVWQRSALVQGAEIALLAAPMPGTSPQRGRSNTGPGMPCSTCPGGRAGPGGAYAYSKPEDFVIATGRSAGSTNVRLLRMTREPNMLTEAAARGDQLSPRIGAILAKVTWPGKAGDAPIVPLTSEEQRRFDAGREVYTNLCQACHQPDGRGQSRVAPSLVDSALLLAAADIPARILLNGKEGTTGLMPPVGSTLTDEQVASVLTYARREWGQTGSPVDPAVIASVREQTRTRTRPWTHDELMKMALEKR